MIHQVRVIFGDTDQMGVVYYGNFMRFFEASRAAFLRSVGKGGADLRRLEVGFPVAEAYCKYRRPAHYEDLLDIDVRVTELKLASLRFEYRVSRDGELLAEGFTVHACTTDSGRPTRIPAELSDVIAPGVTSFQ